MTTTSMHPGEDRLHDFVDGFVDDGEARGIEQHLEACDACRELVDSIRQLLGEAAGLSPGIAPARDLWPGFAQRGGLELDRTGALAVGEDGWLDEIAHRWHGLQPGRSLTLTWPRELTVDPGRVRAGRRTQKSATQRRGRGH